MAIRFMDGFDKYHTTNNTDIPSGLARNYTSVVNDNYIRTQAGRYTGNALNMAYGKNSTYITKAISATGVTKFIVGFNIKMTSQSSFGAGNLWIGPSNATNVIYGWANKGLSIAYTGGLYYNGYSGSSAGAMEWGALALNTWTHIEMEWPITAGVGNPAILYVNGVLVASNTNALASIGWNGTLRIGSTGSGYPSEAVHIDDFYMLDDTGSTNNSRLSTATYVPRIETIVPTSDVANDFSLTGVASAYLAGDNRPVNSGQYASSGTDAQKVRFGNGDLTNINNINCVQFNALCSNSVTGADNWKFLMNNTEVGSTKSVSDSLLSSTAIASEAFEVNPITSAAWTASDVNSIETGIINKP